MAEMMLSQMIIDVGTLKPLATRGHRSPTLMEDLSRCSSCLCLTRLPEGRVSQPAVTEQNRGLIENLYMI